MRTRAQYALIAIGTIGVALLVAQTTTAPAGISMTATTANVAGAPDPVRIEILRWSTDEERQNLMSAWELKPSANAAKGKQGKGGGKGGAGGGKGRGGGAAEPAAPLTPESSLTTALQEATTVGYIWSSESAGYALRYASRITNPDKSQRILLLTERKLGATNQLWKPTFKGEPNAYEFSAIDLRLNAKGEGEGRVSLLGKVAPDAAGKIIALENYDASPAVFRDVRIQTTKP